MRVPRPSGKMAVAAATAVAVVLAAIAALAFVPGKDKVSQPIAFSHKIHVAKDIDCSYCHEHVENSPKATLPSKQVCLGCHQKALGQNPEEPKVRALAAQGPIPWV